MRRSQVGRVHVLGMNTERRIQTALSLIASALLSACSVAAVTPPEAAPQPAERPAGTMTLSGTLRAPGLGVETLQLTPSFKRTDTGVFMLASSRTDGCSTKIVLSLDARAFAAGVYRLGQDAALVYERHCDQELFLSWVARSGVVSVDDGSIVIDEVALEPACGDPAFGAFTMSARTDLAPLLLGSDTRAACLDCR